MHRIGRTYCLLSQPHPLAHMSQLDASGVNCSSFHSTFIKYCVKNKFVSLLYHYLDTYKLVCHCVHQCVSLCISMFITLCTSVCHCVYQCLSLCTSVCHCAYQCLSLCVSMFVTVCTGICHSITLMRELRRSKTSYVSTLLYCLCCL